MDVPTDARELAEPESIDLGEATGDPRLSGVDLSAIRCAYMLISFEDASWPAPHVVEAGPATTVSFWTMHARLGEVQKALETSSNVRITGNVDPDLVLTTDNVGLFEFVAPEGCVDPVSD